MENNNRQFHYIRPSKPLTLFKVISIKAKITLLRNFISSSYLPYQMQYLSNLLPLTGQFASL